MNAIVSTNIAKLGLHTGVSLNKLLFFVDSLSFSKELNEEVLLYFSISLLCKYIYVFKLILS